MSSLGHFDERAPLDKWGAGAKIHKGHHGCHWRANREIGISSTLAVMQVPSSSCPLGLLHIASVSSGANKGPLTPPKDPRHFLGGRATAPAGFIGYEFDRTPSPCTCITCPGEVSTCRDFNQIDLIPKRLAFRSGEENKSRPLHATLVRRQIAAVVLQPHLAQPELALLHGAARPCTRGV